MNLIVICLDTFRADLIGPKRKMSHVATPNLDALDEPQHHQPLHLRISDVDAADDALLAALQSSERVAVDCHPDDRRNRQRGDLQLGDYRFQ